MAYQVPQFASKPIHSVGIEVLKDGVIIENLSISEKDHYVFGRNGQVADILLEHPSVSRIHAIIQHSKTGEMFLYDNESTHGTIINKKQLIAKTYVPLHVGDVIKIGQSTRLFIITGPEELLPQEGPSRAEIQQMKSKSSVSVQNGGEVMWGQSEDAEDDEDDIDKPIDELLNFAKLSERQQKLFDKIKAKHSKIDHLEQEIEKIRAKEVVAELTEGQQHRLKENATKITEIQEEVVELEDQLRESLMDNNPKFKLKKKRDDDSGSSGDDEYFDRTGQKSKKKQKKSQSTQSTSTEVDNEETLKLKIETLLQEKEECKRRRDALKHEKSSEKEVKKETEEEIDPLDSFMNETNQKLELDKVAELNKMLEEMEVEEKRLRFLLKIVTPSIADFKPATSNNSKNVTTPFTKLLAKEREKDEAKKISTIEKSKQEQPVSKVSKAPSSQSSSQSTPQQPTPQPTPQQSSPQQTTPQQPTPQQPTPQAEESKTFSTPKPKGKPGPLILGFTGNKQSPQNQSSQTKPELDFQKGGLQIRKPSENQFSSPNPKKKVSHLPLIKKIKNDEDDDGEGEYEQQGDGFEENDGHFEESTDLTGNLDTVWIPPTNQTGDGRTSLNDKYGY